MLGQICWGYNYLVLVRSCVGPAGGGYVRVDILVLQLCYIGQALCRVCRGDV